MMGGDPKGDTFLTDMLMTGDRKPAAKGTKKGKAVFSSASKPNLRTGSAAARKTPTKANHDLGGGAYDED